MDMFKVPLRVKQSAIIGLLARSAYGRGGTSVGIGRAKQLIHKKEVSLATIVKMHRFFSRHQKNKNTPFEKGNGKIAWLLWGGDPARRWVKNILKNYE